MRTVGVLGAGSWGTALAVHLARVGHDVRLWARDPALVDAHMNLAIVYYSKGKLKESTHHLETILKLDPNNEKAKALLRRMAE